MAASLPENLAEIFLNSDSEDEFEGFDLQDLKEVEPPVEFDNFDVADWRDVATDPNWSLSFEPHLA